jgi:hypothetical protein
MAAYGYSYVTDKGFSAFARELEQSAWKDISIKKYNVEDRKPSSPLVEAPRPVIWKLRASWCIADLDAALGLTTEQLMVLDAEWDAAQRALNLYLASEAEHKDADRRAAAVRLRGSLLAGAGAEQTGYTYDEEVDFGYQQLSRADKAPLEADTKLLGLAPYLKRIDHATDALAKGIGREPGKKRAAARSKRLREAVTACTTAFNAIHDELDWLLAHTPAGKHRDALEALHAPFLALLDRYPPRATPEPEPAAPPPDQAPPAQPA